MYHSQVQAGCADCGGSQQSCCGYLLTEDLQAGQEIDGATVDNPFLTAIDDLPD
jgi:hypothetical protein